MFTNDIYAPTDVTQKYKEYKALGLDPLPIPYVDGLPRKFPTETGWPEKAAAGRSLDDFQEPCNIGNLLGGPHHITDVDCDVLLAAEIAAGILPERFGKTYTFGRKSKPKSHYIYSCDESLPTEQIRDPLTDKMVIEFRCVKKNGERGSQSVFPGSVHESGEQIENDPDSTGTITQAKAKKLLEAVRTIGALTFLAKHFPVKGHRHDCILALAGMFCRAGKPEGFAASVISLAYRHSVGYNYDLNKVESDIRGVYSTFHQSADTHLFGYTKLIEILPVKVVDKVLELLNIEKPQGVLLYHLTDVGNGKRFVDMFRDRVRFCVEENSWYVWDGSRWSKDVAHSIHELAKEVGIQIRQEANLLTPGALKGDAEQAAKFENLQKKLLKWVELTESVHGMKNLLTSASSDPTIICRRSDFDVQPHLLNVANGVVNLKTGELLSHHPALMLSQLCPTEYHPEAKHEKWDESLDAFTRKHADLKDWLQLALGYSIQGRKCEDRIMVCHGPGESGKGTLFLWVLHVLGNDYACTVDTNTISKHKRDSSGPSSDIVLLAGKRVIVASELEKHNELQQGFLKAFSGGDRITARGLYSSDIEIAIVGQLFIQSNYRPGIDSQDSGNLRRFLETPFDNELSKDPLVAVDKTLKSRMAEDDRFKQAVLAWMVEGCQRWYREGRLTICPSVETATKQLFKSNDFLGDFLEERCIITKSPNDLVTVNEMHNFYENWCNEQGEQPALGRVFNHMLEERGLIRKQTRNPKTGVNAKHWLGVQLKSSYIYEQEDVTHANRFKDRLEEFLQ